MRRRKFITLLGGAAALPLAARAQQPSRLRHVGVLVGGSDDAETQARIVAFKSALQDLGWVEGRNARIDLRPTSQNRAADVEQLIASGPDIIFVAGNPDLAAVQRATRTIPIVFVLVGNPVGSGFVASLNRPGGNATGFSHYEHTMGGKWLEVLKEIAPGIRRTLVLFHPDVVANVEFLRAAEAAGPVHGVGVTPAGVRNESEIEQAVQGFASGQDGGIVVFPNPINGAHHRRIVELALNHRLPAIAAFGYIAKSGLLCSYGIDTLDFYRRAAGYVDRILRGTRPSELPVQLPIKFQLAINTKTATALGLTVPPSLLARADEVIE
jgi:putative tryptophan/tyrosine transport system substrate-binding protein